MSWHKFLFTAGARLRNPSLWKQYAFLRDSEKWPPERLRQYQQEQLLRFLEYAGTHSAYYREQFAGLGWKPGMPFTMDLFRSVPVLEKTTLIRDNERIHTAPAPGKLFACETSGTSGQTLTFRRDEPWDSFNRAAIMRGYAWHGVHPWDYNIYFWGFNFSAARKWKVRFMDYLVNRHRLFGYTQREVQRLVRKLPKAVYVEGYSSMIYELALAAGNMHADVSKLKMVKGTSEKIYPHYQEAALKFFGRRIISEYGSAESGIIAFECASGHMHTNMEGVYVETDTDGELIVTNFRSLSFPVIRYRLGDAIRLEDPGFKCPCGMAHPVIAEVSGRVGKVVVGKQGRYPSLTWYNVFKNLWFGHGLMLNYQVRQHEPGVVEIHTRENIAPEQERLIREEVKKYFASDLDIQFHPGSELRLYEGKLRDFITTLPDTTR